MDTEHHPAIQEMADTQSERIEGFLPGNIPISIPLYSHIEDGLWMGGCPTRVLPERFKYAVNLYGQGYGIGRGQSVLMAPMDDSTEEVLEREHMLTLAQTVKRFMATGPTLVHCQAGINRSGLLASLVLMLHGMSAEGAIRMLRAKRSEHVLSNVHFANWLRLEERRMRQGIVK